MCACTPSGVASILYILCKNLDRWRGHPITYLVIIFVTTAKVYACLGFLGRTIGLLCMSACCNIRHVSLRLAFTTCYLLISICSGGDPQDAYTPKHHKPSFPFLWPLLHSATVCTLTVPVPCLDIRMRAKPIIFGNKKNVV